MERTLPPDIITKVLSFLPVPSLSRFRVVCKDWNQLVQTTSFATLNSKASFKRSYVLFTPRVEVMSPLNMKWIFLDINDNKCYTLTDEFLNKAIEITKRFQDGFCKVTLAGARGLICVLYTNSSFIDEALFICNPITRTFQEIPILYDISNHYQIISIVPSSRPSTATMFSYSSETLEWKILCNLDMRPHSDLTIIMDNVVYTLYETLELDSYKMVSYHIKNDNIKRYEIDDLPSSGLGPKLVVSAGRLFRISWHRTLERYILQIWEISQPELKWILIANVPKEIKITKNILRETKFLAVGCDKSIFIATWDGYSITYNVVKNTWCSLLNKHFIFGARIFNARDSISFSLLDLPKINGNLSD
ncbi:hypothetical protein KC19_7G132200 [Ceratodon purpureus]|uniref:F-box domain-containing protein n=1 Tax=Ceratodon purpureus TaxID=3225 RepID=A0A8T0HAJ9_CERPU|nr:hypothetical protein KC19_7G132200 [Ceratodon purpureus]